MSNLWENKTKQNKHPNPILLISFCLSLTENKEKIINSLLVFSLGWLLNFFINKIFLNFYVVTIVVHLFSLLIIFIALSINSVQGKKNTNIKREDFFLKLLNCKSGALHSYHTGLEVIFIFPFTLTFHWVGEKIHTSGDAENKIVECSCIESKLLLGRIRMLQSRIDVVFMLS